MKIVSLTLVAADLRPIYEFYAGDLAMQVIKRNAELVSVQIGESVLTFRRGDTRHFYHFAINTHPTRFERARAALAALTPLLHDADGQEVFEFRSWNARACYFYDPAGNIVELIARRDLTAMPVPADPGFTSVSEIGLVAEDIPALAARITRELGVPVYRDSAGDTFAALGDEEGLLILAQRGRIWYPDTGKAAVPAPVGCELQAGDDKWNLQGPPYGFSRVGDPRL
jgi:catechol-2,3-dioxygenase